MKTTQPLTVTLEDFTINTDLAERPCEFHYELRMTRPAIHDAWEIERVIDFHLVREMPGWFVPMVVKGDLEAHIDLRLELEAILSDEPEQWQRLQQAANDAAEAYEECERA